MSEPVKFTTRLDPARRAQVDALAQRWGVPPAEVGRRAIHLLLDAVEPPGQWAAAAPEAPKPAPNVLDELGTVYFVQKKGEPQSAIKIGFASDLADRLPALKTATPGRLVVLAAFPGTRRDERRLHALFAEHRIEGEWYRAAPAVLEHLEKLRGIGGGR